MSFTRQARQARRNVRKVNSPMIEIMKAGERAYRQGELKSANPYSTNSEEASLWLEGYNDAREVDKEYETCVQ